MQIDLARFDLDAKRLVRAREALDMTQGQLAVALGVSRATVNAWERGRNAIPKYAGLAMERLADLDTGEGFTRRARA